MTHRPLQGIIPRSELISFFCCRWMWKNILWTVEHLDKEQTTYLNPIFEGIWWQSSHQKKHLYLYGASWFQDFYWTKNETSWNLRGRSWDSNLKTSHFLKIIRSIGPWKKLSETFTPGETGSTWSKTLLWANLAGKGKRMKPAYPEKNEIWTLEQFFVERCLFHDPAWHHSRQHTCDRSSLCRSVEAMTLPKLPSLMAGVGLWWRAAGSRKTI